MNTRYFGGTSFGACAVVALLGQAVSPSAASAQPQAAALEEVVVVARRTEERLQDVPISVTAIGAETLRQVSIRTSTDLIKLVPTLSVQQGATGPGAGNSYSLRGIRNGVITYFNEVPTPPIGIDDQIWDLSSVQALAGPQGTLFGRNSTGGAILFVPQRPTGDFDGYVEAGVGNYDYRQLTGVVNIPISDMLQVRLGGRLIRRDGVVKHIGTGSDFQSLHRNVGRISVLFEPNERISNYTVIDYSERDELPVALIAANWTASAGCLAPAPAACLPGYTRGQVKAIGDAQEALGIRRTSANDPTYTKSQTWGITNIFTVSLLENLLFKYVGGYRHRDSVEESYKVNISLPIQDARHNNFGSKDWSHELQFQGNFFDEHFIWTAGLFTSRLDGFTGSETGLFLPPGTPLSFANSVSNRIWLDNESKAAFAQGTLKLNDRLNFTGGVRYTKDKSTQVNSRRQPQSTFFGPNVCGLPVGAQGVDLVNCLRTLKGGIL